MQNCYNFKQNTDLITSSGAITTEWLQQLNRLGYQLVLNLLPDSDKRAIANEQQIVEAQHIAYCYILVDFKYPQLSEYQQFCNILNTHSQRKIHIHCAANYRASAFFAAYQFEKKQWSQQQAEDFIEELWQPQDYHSWLHVLQQVGLYK
jgi:protein tyrosine phosphatase (PTP) superfamily phosphohydrolase (DUF442 family)